MMHVSKAMEPFFVTLMMVMVSLLHSNVTCLCQQLVLSSSLLCDCARAVATVVLQPAAEVCSMVMH
jgi:hypothetical protein